MNTNNISGLNTLRKIFSQLYSVESDARRVVQDAGMDVTRIDFSGSALNYWHNIVNYAYKQEKLTALVKVVTDEYAVWAGQLQIFLEFCHTPQIPQQADLPSEQDAIDISDEDIAELPIEYEITFRKEDDRFVLYDVTHKPYKSIAISKVMSLAKQGVDPAAVEAYGRQLYDLMLAQTPFESAKLKAAHAHRWLWLTIRTRVDNEMEIGALRWELLHDGTGFLSLHKLVVLRVSGDTFHRSLTVTGTPLRLLLSTNTSPSTDAGACREEERLIREVAHRYRENLTVTVLRDANRNHLFRELIDAEYRDQGYHIWHHWGAAQNTTKGLRLLLEDGPVALQQVANILNQTENLKIVSLHLAGHSGFAPWNVASLPVPLIIATWSPVNLIWAHGFFREFYHGIHKQGIRASIGDARRIACRLHPESQSLSCLTVQINTLDHAVLPLGTRIHQ